MANVKADNPTVENLENVQEKLFWSQIWESWIRWTYSHINF